MGAAVPPARSVDAANLEFARTASAAHTQTIGAITGVPFIMVRELSTQLPERRSSEPELKLLCLVHVRKYSEKVKAFWPKKERKLADGQATKKSLKSPQMAIINEANLVEECNHRTTRGREGTV